MNLSTGRQTNRPLLLSATLLSALVLLAGCGEQKKSATQVAAKIGKDEVTIGQVNAALSKMQVVPGKTEAQVKREVLESLINQQLSMRQAIDKKLDRDPAVMQALEDAKRAILANAYADKVRASISGVSDADVSKYYADHPELFAQRRIFNLRELNVAVQPTVADTLRQQVSKNMPLEAIAAELKSKNVPFAGNASTRAAEEIPVEILGKINTLKVGQMALFEGKGALTILQVIAMQPAPVDEKTASASIKRYLANMRSTEEITKSLKTLRDAAKIEYIGEFAAGAATVGTDVAEKNANQKSGATAAAPSSEKDVAKAVSNLQ